MSKTTYPPGYTGAEKRWHRFVDSLCDDLRKIVGDLAPDNVYWRPDNGDTGELFCSKCVGPNSDGGWDGEEDSTPHCEKCGCILSCCLTDYGVREELGYSTDDEQMGDPIGQDEAYTLLDIIECGVPRLTERCGDFVYGAEYKPLLRRLRKRLDLGRKEPK